MRRNLIFLSGLLVLTLAILWPVGKLGFIDFDDYDYVCRNDMVQSGLNLKSVMWAFTAACSSNWHPVTWLSHMLDCQLFGLNPHEEHWVNLWFHVANALLLFLWLWQLTGARWRSFLVAALFATHPLHIQSVAWISERKDVLSGFFALLTLLAYTRYSRHKTPANYVLVIVLFALGLMAKPMLVTLPFVLALLDYWPLARTNATTGRTTPSPPRFKELVTLWQPLVVEKIPLVLLCLASCIVTVWAQSNADSLLTLGQIGWAERCQHVVYSYVLYLEKLFWPVNLAVFYPYALTRPTGGVFLGAILFLVLMAVVCLWRSRSQPYLLVGGCWFLITLAPVIGIVQAGEQGMADRYMYLPSIGIFIIVAWAMSEIAARSKFWRAGMAGLGLISVIACGTNTRHQLGFWRDSVTLFKHVLEVSPEDNYLGHYYLGNSYLMLGALDKAANQFTLALQIKPDFERARRPLGNIMINQKHYRAAEAQFREILKTDGENVAAHMSLGFALADQGNDTAAQEEYQSALQLLPGDPRITKILAASFRRIDAKLALTNLTEQLKTNATLDIRMQLAEAQTVLGQYRQAADHYQKALSLAPDSPAVLNNLAWLLATCPDPNARDGKRAVLLAEQACTLTQDKKTIFLGTLAAAYAEAGRFDDAIATAQKACTNAANLGEADLLGSNQQLLAQYQKHQPHHEVAEKLVPGAP